MQIPNRRGPVDTPHLFCPVEDGSNPGGDRKTPNDPNPPFWARGRERERERERVGRSGKGTERSNREEREREWGAGERAGENVRERVGERPTEQESGANRRKGRVVGLS